MIRVDLDVMMALCDKIMVLCHGQLMGVVHAHKTSKEEMGMVHIVVLLTATNRQWQKPYHCQKNATKNFLFAKF